jgi:hypothetical protein
VTTLPPQSLEKRALITKIRTELRQRTGREYGIEWGVLDIMSLRELGRAIRDLEDEHINAVGKARLLPWRR